MIAILILLIFFTQSYEPFTMDGEGCLSYTEKCYCVGNLLILESYPMQYNCQGINYCFDIEERTECF